MFSGQTISHQSWSVSVQVVTWDNIYSALKSTTSWLQELYALVCITDAHPGLGSVLAGL